MTPTLRASWLAGVLVTLAFFVIATEALGSDEPVLFLLVAPLVPLAAVAVLSWRTGDGRHRHLGEPPADAELLAPTLEDGYLLLVGTEANESVS